MNQYLGSTNTEFQVNYLGTRLSLEVLEWFLRNVEHFEWDIRDWTLETVVAGLQQHFLHTLTHHHASNRFESVMQGNKTVHEILNNLKKYTDCMVMQPDEYTFCRRFISALQEPLRQEVLKQGLNPEKSTINQLYEFVNAIEEATRYNQGTHRTEGIGTIPSTTQQSIVSKPIALNQSVHKPTPITRLASQPTQHSRPVNVVRHEPRTAPAVPTNKNTPYWGVTHHDHP